MAYRILIQIFILLASVLAAQAATVYVDNSATGCSTPSDTDYDPDTRSCGSGSFTVYDNVPGAVNSRASGDTVIIKPGSYTNATSPNTPAGNLTITGNSKEDTFISGERLIVDTDNNQLSNFRISCANNNYTAACLYVSGDNNYISNVSFLPSWIDTRALYLGGDYNTVTDCLWDYGLSTDNIGTHTGSDNASTLTDSTKNWTTNSLVNKYVVNAVDGSQCVITANTSNTITCTLTGGSGEKDWDSGDAYFVADGVGSVPVQTDGAYNYIQNSVFQNIGHIHAVYFAWGTNNHFRNNYITNIRQIYSNIHADIMQTWGGTGFTTGSYIWFENNFVSECEAQHFWLSNDASNSPGNFYITNNVYKNVNVCGGSGVPYTYLIGNTFIGGCSNTYGIRFLYTGANGTFDSSNSVVKNNSFIGMGTYGGDDDRYGWFAFENSPPGTSSSNNHVSKSRAAGYAAKSYWNTNDGNLNGGDPKFVDYDNNNFSIQSDSPFRDAGADVSSILGAVSDRAGVSRPQGTAWDIGAYEYMEMVKRFGKGITITGGGFK